ncbi:FAD-dependent oxidoreductase [Actinosynnema sp. CS-041913]|uniref:FAD-dependent oxidoreductase n=1 Tax=Actinosynnema sp. CS-041913 TaxID=3239917 RepID=UPI003D8BF0C3
MRTTQDFVGDRAVVIGGSIAGTLAARVLAESYREVVVVDRDKVVGVDKPRVGASHAVHAHGLHARGYLVMSELFPGLLEEARAAGLSVRDFGAMHWYFHGRRTRPADTGLLSIAGNRPLLEGLLRARVAALPNVVYRDCTEVLGPLTTSDRRTVIGVRLRPRVVDAPEQRRDADAVVGATEPLDADLVVDASGRGSRLPVWLAELGYERPEEERVKIRLAYTTRMFRRSPETFDGPMAINTIASPAHPRGAFFGQAASGHCLLSLTGMVGDHPPTDADGFLAYTRSLPVPDIHDAVRDADPVTDAVSFKFPSAVWRHYERLARFPKRLVVLGDAVSCLNPVYGQGMTVAATQAMALRSLLRGNPDPDTLDPRAAFARAVSGPWRLSSSGDLDFPGVVGSRPLRVRVHNAYLSRVQYAATKDPEVTRALMRVTGLIDPIRALWRPRLVAKVWWLARNRPGRSVH